MSDRKEMRPTAPVHTEVRSEKKYADLDPGIRFAVRVLNAAGISTSESCEGGEGHAFIHPSIVLTDQRAFAAMETLESHGMKVREVASVWRVNDGLPYEQSWRVSLRSAVPERANERPMFITGHLHRDCWEPA